MAKKINVLVKCIEGVGDNIYIRTILKKYVEENHKKCNIFVSTVLPNIYKDIENITLIDPNKETYRTQSKEYAKYKHLYTDVPADKSYDKIIETNYSTPELLRGSVVLSLFTAFGLLPTMDLDWSLPDFTEEFCNAIQGKNFNSDFMREDYAIIRPATIRSEWEVTTRNPKPEYIGWCTKILRDSGIKTVSIADLAPKAEWLEGGYDPQADIKLHNGELGIYGTLHLIQKSKIVVGGSGFIVPATISSNSNLFLISGGRLLFDSISKVIHPSMNLSRIGWSIPDNPCKCDRMDHNCSKSISHLDSDFFNFLEKVFYVKQ